MICKNTFNEIFNRAKNYKYSSMNHITFEDCKNAEILHNTGDLILMRDNSKAPAMLYFAANDFGDIIKIIQEMPKTDKLRLHFVPKEFAPHLKELDFKEWAEFGDYWNTDLLKTAASFENTNNNTDSTEYLDENDCKEASLVSQRCKLQSVGFEGVTYGQLKEYLIEGKVIILRKGASIAGFCAVSVYNEGTTLWIRIIAVDPAHQGLGLSKQLIEQAITYGIQSGATKGFLAADALNENAIGLFKKYGFHSKNTESELQMIRE
jgi:ribosomal protein S18 acetylase RimI-like enzyme